MDVNLPILFSDHVEFRAKFQQYWDTVRVENLGYLSVFYTLVGYFSTMKTNGIYDQVSRDRMDILKVLVAGHRDRFYLLFVARHSVSKSMTGRLLYFHMNQQAPFFDGSFLSLDDLQVIRDNLKNYDPSLTETELGLWMQKVRENCLFVGVRKIRPTYQNPNSEFKVDTNFVRIDQMFQPVRSGEAKFRELSTSNSDLSHVTLDDLYKTFKTLIDAFKKNSETEHAAKLVFYFNKQNFLNFVRGALFFNAQNLEITAMCAGETVEKLAILIQGKSRWITDQEPIFVEVYRSSEEKLESEFDTEIGNLPIGFGTSAKEAVVVSVTVSQGNDLDIGVRKVEIAHSANGLLDFLGKLTTLEVDNFKRNQDYFRRELLLHLDRVDTFLGHQHKIKILRHYILGQLMTMDNGFNAYKLRHTFDPTNPVDIFLIRSEDNGFVISLSSNVVDLHVSDVISDRILETGSRKLVIVTLNDESYSVKSRDGETINPLIGVIANDSPYAEFSPIFDSSHWSSIKTKFGPNMLSQILLTQRYQAIRSAKLKREWEDQSMIPTNRVEFSAQLKAMVPEKEAFRPYGTDFIGFTVKKFGNFKNALKVPDFMGNRKLQYHVILDLEEGDQNDPLRKLKRYFKRELSSSLDKLNTGLAKVTLTSSHENEVPLKFTYFTSFPNGENKEEYESCYPRRKRSGKSCLVNFEEKEKPSHYSIHRVINTAMYLQMIKGMIGSAIDANYKKMASEAGILVGMISMSFIGDQSIRWGQNLMKSGHLLRGGPLYLGGKFLSKAYLGFVIADLVSRIKTFELGDKDQILGIVGDTAILTINTVSAGVEIFSTFATVEEASLELGPEILITEALIFTIIDGFYAAKSVEKIEREIVLSWGEKFVQWWRSFFGARTSGYIDPLIREKILLQKSVDEMIQKLLLLNQTFQYYATPTLYINDQNHVQQTEDNLILMDSMITVESRVWPESKDDFKVECASDGYDKNILETSRFRVESDRLGFTTDGAIHRSVFCRNMVSVSTNAKNAETALIELGTGQDTVEAFENKKNYFIVAGGKKHITGGRYADTFIFIGNSTKILGEIDGLDGPNVLDLSQYLQSESLHMNMLADKLIYSDDANLMLKGVEHIIGRSGSSDRIESSCRTRFLDLKGGKSNQFPDMISIPDLNCDQNFSIKLSGHIQVNNLANNSNVLYLVQNGTNAQINTVSSSIFLLSASLKEVDSLHYENCTLKIKSSSHDTTLVVYDPMRESKFIFSDQFQVTFLENNLHAKFQASDSNLVDRKLINDFLLLSQKLSLIITVTSEQKVMQINNLHSSIHSQVVHFKNDPNHETEIMTVDHGQIFFEVDANCDFQKMECHISNISVHVLDMWNFSNVIVDLSAIHTLFRENHQELILNIENSTDHVSFDLKLENQTFSRIKITYENYMLKDSLCSKLLMNIKVLMRLCYESDQGKFVLSPIPVKVSTNDSIIVLSEDDTVENMEISTDKQITSIKCRSFKNSLILTNDLDDHQKDALTLIFIDYFYPLNVTVHESNRILFDSLVIRYEDSKQLIIPEIIRNCNFMIERTDF